MKPHTHAPSRCIIHSTVAHCHRKEMPQFAHCRPLTLPHLSSNFRKYFLKGVRTSSRTHGTRVNALYNPFPFNADDYHRANLQLLQGDDQQMTGLMLFQKENKDGDIIDDGEGLVIAIGGDTFQAIVLLLQGRLEIRPLTVGTLALSTISLSF